MSKEKEISVSGSYINNGEVNTNINFDDMGFNGSIGTDGSAHLYNNPNTTITYTYNNVFNAETAKEKAIEFLSNHEITKRILSRIEDVSSIGEFSYIYDFRDDEKKGIWHTGIIDYFQEVLGFDVSVNLDAMTLYISWDL